MAVDQGNGQGQYAVGGRQLIWILGKRQWMPGLSRFVDMGDHMRRYKLAAIAAGVALAGCATMGMNKFQDPSIELTSMRIRGLGITGGAVDLVLSVTNPNNFDLRGTQLALGLDVEGTHLGDALLNDAFNLPKDKPTDVIVPLTFQWAGVGVAAQSALTYGTVKYQIKGTASLQTPWGVEKVPFTRDGTVAVNGVRQQNAPPSH
jgi:LEA14-like dessication related protein